MRCVVGERFKDHRSAIASHLTGTNMGLIYKSRRNYHMVKGVLPGSIRDSLLPIGALSTIFNNSLVESLEMTCKVTSKLDIHPKKYRLSSKDYI
jgi:hypothetical protein